MEYIAFDSHRRYTFASVADEAGTVIKEEKIAHERGALQEFLVDREPGSAVAVETIGNWYWIVEEIEAAGMVPQLVHARRAKMMMGMTNKTDKLDARGMNQLQRNEVLPTVWIPPGELRDARDLPRTRMVLVSQRTKLKNRFHATLAKYALKVSGAKDPFGTRARAELLRRLGQLPANTRFSAEQLLAEIDMLSKRIREFERRMKEVFKLTPEVELLMTIPGVGFILGVLMAMEIGDISRFARCDKLAAYAGTTPRVHASGGKTRHGRMRSDVNRYLKWAFVEAANAVSTHRRRWQGRHVVRIYERIAGRKSHQKGIGALARHLAEAAYWVLTKKEKYKEPKNNQASSTKT